MSKGIVKTFDIGDGRKISIETGKLARQAHGAVVVKMDNTMLLATVVANKDPKEGIDFLPLTVDYQEKFASSGKIPGGFLKRESRLSDYEILISRLVDRALRPMFPDDYHCEIQVMISLISADKNVMPDALAAFAASAAISVSDIPFNGPISEVRVARIKDKYIVNPYISDLEKADIDLIVAADKDNIIMVEGESKECSEGDIVEALNFAHNAIKIQCKAQLELAEAVGVKGKREIALIEEDSVLIKRVKDFSEKRIAEIAKSSIKSKHERSEKLKSIIKEFIATLSPEELEEKEPLAKKYFHDLENRVIRKTILENRIRLDGRKLDEIRDIWSEIDYIPGSHGSAVFTRGETQSLTTVTLGDKDDIQKIDGAMFEGTRPFILHYNFPSFSTGEIKPSRGPGRREVGHGNLAYRSLKNVLPQGEDNPYTIRLVSDILESNGSSSMATVCAGSLALMDSGIKIKSAVSGIAMGLIMDEETGKYAVLSDILGDEDHLGDMDFKITGTTNGIMACQMDLKVKGLTSTVLLEALNQAKAGRLHILNEMNKTISQPKSDLKPHAPRIISFVIPKEFIGAVIGPGGKVIQEMQLVFEVGIHIEEKDGAGYVSISSNNRENIEKCKARIDGITAIPEIGEIYKGKVKSLKPFGAFVEFLPGKDGLLHVSEISWDRVNNVEDVLKEGEILEVKLVDIDKKTGKYRLSKKALIPREKTKSGSSGSNGSN